MSPAIEAWADAWLAILALALALFVGLSLWVIVAGFFDIRVMFAELRRQAEAGEDPADDES